MSRPSDTIRSGIPLRVVVTPESLGRCLLDPQAQPVLELWRDGHLQPVVCRWLLVRYFRLLHRLALPERLVRWWGWWLSSTTKALVLPDPTPPLRLPELCHRLAVAAEAPYVIGHPPTPHPNDSLTPPAPGPRWISPTELQHLCPPQPAPNPESRGESSDP